ncbi:MAG TPA: hypothetical protein VF234_06800 [Limnochordia bacterium]
MRKWHAFLAEGVVRAMRAASIRLAVLFCLLASGLVTVPGGAAERTSGDVA